MYTTPEPIRGTESPPFTGITVKEVVSKRDLARFVEFPYRLYQGNACWIPPLRQGEAAQFDPDSNPSFSTSRIKLWIAEKQGRVAGRIAGIINERETEARGETIGRFGWLEFEDDLEISGLLLETACQWAKEQGAAWVKGPMGFTNLDPTGLTVEGFDETGTIYCPYHFPYYQTHMECHQFSKLEDTLEHVIENVPWEIPDKLKRLEPIIEQKFGIHQYFPASAKELKELAFKAFYLLEETYKDLSTFVPLTDEQAAWYINNMIPMMKPEYLRLLKHDQEGIIGFGFVVPSYQKAMLRAKGYLFPFGLLHIMWEKKFHRMADLLLIGVEEKWRNKGLNAILFTHYIPVMAKQKVKKVYLGPQSENNYAPYAIFRDYNPRLYRRRRIYRKDL
ncbi:MAG: hypothetical protein WA004_04605 [Saprospiraceae bacterium]